MIYQEWRVCNCRKWLCFTSHVNESMSSQARIRAARPQNKSQELCESHQVWVPWVCKTRGKKLENSSARSTKTSHKRSSNRCKSICIFMNRYQKHILAATEYSATSLSIWTWVNKTWARTLIDTDVTANFMLSSFAKKANILLQMKSNVYTVTDIDEKSLEYNKEMVDHEMKETRLQIELHMNDMQFDIMLIR